MEEVQSVTQDKTTRMMINIYMFNYIKKVEEEIYFLTLQHCFGCREGDASQRKHSCLMMDDIEHLNIHFDDAMENVKCEEVLDLWKIDTHLTDIPEDLQNAFVKLLQNQKWQNEHLPNKDKFYEMVKNVIVLNHRFTS